MSDKGRVLRRIDAVLDSHLSPEQAYPMRARLGRALQEVENLAVEPIHSYREATRGWQEALRRLHATSEHIMQPSEPFDAQWRQQWIEVIADLSLVRRAISESSSSEIAD